METGVFWLLEGTPDDELRSGMGALLASGDRTEARIVAHLAEFDARRLYLEDGYPSLYEYCLQRLGLSNSEAFHRITAARVARRFPVVFEMIEQRRVHLTAVCLLRDHLTEKNHRELLAGATRKTKCQVQELIARRFPLPDVASGVRKLPVARRSLVTAEPRLESSESHLPLPPSPAPAPAVRDPAAPARRVGPSPALIEPRSEDRYRIQLDASRALKEKLEHLRALLSHSIPNGDLAAVVERALEIAIERVEKERFAVTARPQAARPGSLNIEAKRGRGFCARGRAHIPDATQRAVAARDGMQCTYRGPDGQRCSARAFLQIHHEQPWALGGSDEVDNLRLLCGAHNRFLAERDFGAAYVELRRAAGVTSSRQSASRSTADCAPPPRTDRVAAHER